MMKKNYSIVTLPFGAVVTIVVGRSRGGVRRTRPLHVVVVVADQLLDGVVWNGKVRESRYNVVRQVILNIAGDRNIALSPTWKEDR